MLTPVPAANRQINSWPDALSLVRARSTDLATQYAEVRRAEANARTALAAVLPTINGTATAPHQFITRDVPASNTNTGTGTGTGTGTPVGGTGNVSVPASDYVSANITLTQSLVNLQAWDTIGIAKDAVAAQKLTAEDTSRTITLAVATAVVAVVAAERVAELNRVGLKSALERRELSARKRNLGVATGLDVVRADQDVASARATLVTGDESLRKARESLGLALGVPDQVGVPKDMRLDDVVASAGQTCRPIPGLDQRADIAALRKKVDIADRSVHNVELGFLPTLSAGSTLSTTTQNTGLSPPTTWSISAILSVPIWDGGARYGALGSARALRDEAGFALEATQRAASVDLEQSRRNVGVAQQSLDVAKQARDLASQVDELTQAAYRAGQGTSLELVTAASALRSAEIELALREFDLVRARLEALFALAKCPGAT